MKEDHNPFEHEWSGSEWDHMSPWQRKLFVVFIFCIILWGTPVYESMLKRNSVLRSGHADCCRSRRYFRHAF
jgi:hypothetical protein